MKNNHLKLMFLGLILILFISSVSAFSVATLYGDNYPLRMDAGEEKDTFFLLRNVVEGDSDVRVHVELIKGREVATLLDDELVYDVAYGDEIEVPISIKIPENARPGTIYRISALFKPEPKEGGQGNVQFLINIGKSFPVVVLGETGEQQQLGMDYQTLTIEDDQGLVETFAPFAKSSSAVWLILILFLMIGVVVVIVTIIFFVVRSRDRNVIQYIPVPAGNYYQE